MLDQADQADVASAVPLDQIVDPVASAEQYQRVIASGRYHASRQFLWDNRVYKSRAGFEVITPVEQANGSVILVNRGWVPLGLTREDLPDTSMPEALLDKPVTIEGLFSRPSKGFASGEAFDPKQAWPKIIQYFDYEAISRALDATVVAGVLQPQRVGAPAKGEEFFPVNWQPTDAIGPVRHYGYAAQWWTMALVLSVLFVKYGIKREHSE